MHQKQVSFHVDGLNLAGRLYLPALKALHPVVCICHGIPAKKPDLNDKGYPLLAETICENGFAVLIFNFRGAGASEGNLDMLGWTKDLKAVIDYLVTVPELDSHRIALLGFSGGAAVSVYVASKDRRVSAVSACACPAEFTFLTDVERPQSIIEHFRSIGVIRDDKFPHSIDEWLNSFTIVSPINHVAGIAPTPLLLVHGDRDETVPVHHAYQLYDKAGEPKRIEIVDGAGHQLRKNGQAVTIITDWLKSRLLQ